MYFFKKTKEWGRLITKNLKLLKKVANLSVSNSYMTYNPFSAYKVEREIVEIDFLEEE